MPVVPGGYDEWAAAGKPSSGAREATSPWFDKIAAKSNKKSKTTGKSPLDTALASAKTAAIKEITKNATDAAKTTAAASNKEVVARNKASNTTADEASKQQDKQYAALVKGLQTAFAKGTLPAGYDAIAPPVVGVSIPKDQSSPAVDPTSVDIAQPDPSAPLSPTPFDPTKFTVAGQPQPFNQYAQATPKVQALHATMDKQKKEIKASNNASGSGGLNFLNPRSLLDEAGSVATSAIQGVGKGLDYLDRVTAQPVNAFISDMGDPNKSMSDIPADIMRAVQGKIKTSAVDLQQQLGSPDVIKDPNRPGKYLTWDSNVKMYKPAKEAPWYERVPAQVMWDIGMNPSTYVGLSTVSEGAKGIMAGSAAKDAIDVNNEAMKVAAKYAGSKAVAKASETAGKRISKQLVKAGGPIATPVTANEKLANDLLVKAVGGGANLGDAIASTRVAIEHEVAGEMAKQKLATAAVSATKSNRRILNLKLAGKDIPLGKVPFADIPYQGARAAKAKIADTEIGKGLSKMFSTNYWFPGETHTLFNKANSMGVTDFMKTHNEIVDTFKGLTKTERKRVADATEQGVSLAGELGKNGKDLGDVQKYFKKLTAQHFAEDVTRGKYDKTDEVGNFVFHHYLGGSPQKIRDIKGVRKARLKDGEQLTLQEADDLGMKPIREADKILLAHTAEHQRAMLNDTFNRSLVGKYGQVLDNPVLAQKLGLVEAKAPKNMYMKPGSKLYMDPKVKDVYTGVGAFMGKTDEETKQLWRKFDKLMRGWKMTNTTLLPAHHIRNAIGDTFLNYLDGVQNPHRYTQGMKMVTGRRGELRVRVGQQLLTGDDIENLARQSGMNKGFISSEFMEGRNPILNKIQSFSEKREMAGRYAHFIDVLVKEGDKTNLGAKNAAGLWKAATEAGKRVNKWNINYGDLTPFERNVMKRGMPFYTWTRKALPLMIESLATRPGRMQGATQLNNTISNLAGVNPSDLGHIDYPQWLKDVGFARLTDEAEPNVWSVPLPSQDLGKWFGGGTIDSILQNIGGSLNPIAQTAIERMTHKNLYTGSSINPDTGDYLGQKIGVIQTIKDLMDPNKDLANKINKATGVGTRKVSENDQLSELRRQQTPLNAQLNQINKDLGDYAVRKLKYGYEVYNKHYNIAEKTGFSTPEEALVYAIGLSKKAKGQ